jgi:hypothetical protein
MGNACNQDTKENSIEYTKTNPKGPTVKSYIDETDRHDYNKEMEHVRNSVIPNEQDEHSVKSGSKNPTERRNDNYGPQGHSNADNKDLRQSIINDVSMGIQSNLIENPLMFF